MVNPENKYSEDYYKDAINIDSLLKKTESLSHNPSQSKKESKMLTAYIITISKQMEKLLSTTERMMEGRQNIAKPDKSKYVLGVAIVFVLAFSMISYFMFSKKYENLKHDLDNKLQRSFSNVEEMIGQQTKYLKEKNDLSEKSDRTYFINRLDKIEKNISMQNQKISDFNEKVNELNKAETKQYLINNIIEKKNRVASVLDSIQTSKKKSSKGLSKNLLYANAYAKRGWQYSLSREYEEAIREYKRAITLNPEFGMAYYNIACMYTKLHQNKKALEWLKKGKPYFDKKIIQTAKNDPDLTELRQDPYFSLIIN